MRLYLVRHGESLWNAESRHQGWSSVNLSARGVRQAEALGTRLCSVPFTSCYSSPIFRARRTAQLVTLQFRGAPPIHTSCALRERRLRPEWEGRTHDEIRGLLTPAELVRHHQDYGFHYDHGESPSEIMTRIRSFIETLTATVPASGNVLLVTHKMHVQLFLIHAAGAYEGAAASGWDRECVEIGNASISVIEFDKRFRILSVNDTSHLDVPLGSVATAPVEGEVRTKHP
jgi:broad specificity phosphatase PhoE